MKNWKNHLVVAAVLAAAAAVLSTTLAQPVWAQVRAALVRDTDAPDLAPFQAGINSTLVAVNTQFLLTTVPAGKRLVLDSLSYVSSGADQLIFGSLRSGVSGPTLVFMEIHPPHISASGALSIQDGSQPVKAYFEAGEEVWVSLSRSVGLGNRPTELRVTGHYVTP